MKRVWLPLYVTALLGLAGCESAAQKCGKARAAARDGWAVYVSALEKLQTDLNASQVDVHRRLTTIVDPRLMPEAQKQADARYPRSAEAWLRASKVAFNELCAKDPDCASLRDKKRDETATLADLAERLPLAVAARDATKAAVERAVQTSEAAILDPARPALKGAQQLTAALTEQCKDVPLGAADEAPHEGTERKAAP